jgi:hypothetical protein
MMEQAATDAGALAGADRLANGRCYFEQLVTG